MIKIKKKNTFHSVALSRMSCMLSLKTVAKRKKKLDFTYLCRYHSLAEEPTEKKKKESQALQQAKFTLIFSNSDSVSLGGNPSCFFRMGFIMLYIYPDVSV